MTRAKICGITKENDLSLAVELGYDFVGLIFCQESPRCISRDRARALARLRDGQTKLVGVFMNQPLSEVNIIADSVGLDLVQLHGLEDSKFIEQVERPVIKTIFYGLTGKQEKQDLEKNCPYLLLDKPKSLVPDHKDHATISLSNLVETVKVTKKQFFIAGGISMTSAKSTIESFHPYGIDLSSALEKEVGVKDHKLMRDLIETVRAKV